MTQPMVVDMGEMYKAGEIHATQESVKAGQGGMHLFADYHPNTSYRTCAICGKCESQTRTWK